MNIRNWGEPERATLLSYLWGEKYCRGWTTTSQACAMMSTRTRSVGGAPPLASYEWAGLYCTLYKWTGSRGGGTWQLLKLGKTGRHNESSASGQGSRGGGTWQLLKLGKTGRHNESSASGQGSRGGGTWQLLKLGKTGRHNESSASGQGSRGGGTKL